MDLVKEFKQQYLITQKAREDDLYSKDHMNAMAKLEKLFYKIPEHHKMGTCDADCKQEMIFKKVDGGRKILQKTCNIDSIRTIHHHNFIFDTQVLNNFWICCTIIGNNL